MPLKFDTEWLEYAKAASAAIPTANIRPVALHDVAGRRANSEIRFPVVFGLRPAAPSVTVTEHKIKSYDGATISVYQFTPAAASATTTPGPALLHIHGGWTIVGSVKAFEKQIAWTAADTGIPVFSVEYRLAPEHKHPTPVEDAYAALVWLRDNASQLGVDLTRIGVFGESAGGGLTAGVCLLARDRKLEPPVSRMMLIYPMLDHHPAPDDAELRAVIGGDIYEDQITGWSALLGRDVSTESVDDIEGLLYASPARATDLRGLPDAYVDAGTLDILLDEDIEFARRLQVQGKVNTELHVYPGVTHGFEGAGYQSAVAAVARENRTRWLKRL